ncbi:MAG TPA: D-amino-acid transaminase [Rhizobiaceae bacterium]|nr:D-amino-acid transaminase [Rhizobiaceae bacterium]
MSRIAYVNGRYLPHADAVVHVEDRGYQLADGVYEVCELAGGKMLDVTGHLDRLDRSLRELSMREPVGRAALLTIMREIVRRNRMRDGMVYIQVTRGVARRDHVYPPASVKPALVVTAKRIDPAVYERYAEKGVAVITLPDNRWDRVDIKTVGLLPNAMARQKAREAGASEAWFVDSDGNVTEGAATNAWIVTEGGDLVTRPANHGILRGITRETVLKAAASLGIAVTERPFSVAEALRAREAFLTSATNRVMPVVSIDSNTVANGHPGSIARALRERFFAVAEKTPC